MSRDDEPGDDDRPRGLIRSLLELLDEMERRGERTRSGHGNVGRTSFGYSVDIGGLSDAVDEADRGRVDDRATSSISGEEALVTTRETSEGVVLAVDLPGVREDELATRFDRESEEVVVNVDGREAVRLPLEDEGWTVDRSRFANGVLEVTIRRE